MPVRRSGPAARGGATRVPRLDPKPGIARPLPGRPGTPGRSSCPHFDTFATARAHRAGVAPFGDCPHCRRLIRSPAAVALATLARWVVGGQIVEGLPFITYYPAIIIATLAGG